MAYCHLAHDCVVGNHTIFANNASLAGHVTIGDYVVLGGYTLVFQFCRIGDYAMTAFAAGVHKDVPPYFMASGYRADRRGSTAEGMRRNGFTAEQISAVEDVYKTIAAFRLKKPRQTFSATPKPKPSLPYSETFSHNRHAASSADHYPLRCRLKPRQRFRRHRF